MYTSLDLRVIIFAVVVHIIVCGGSR